VEVDFGYQVGKKLAATLKDRLAGVVRGTLDGRSNAYVEAMKGMLQQDKRAARGFRTVKNFVAIAYLRMPMCGARLECAALVAASVFPIAVIAGAVIGTAVVIGAAIGLATTP